MLHFVLGRIKSGKTSYIIERIRKADTMGALYIVPEQFSHITERLLCKALGNSASLFTEVTSFRRLATKIKSEVGGLSANIIGDGTRILYLHSAIRDIAPALTALSKDALRPDKLSSLLTAIDEFKSYGVTPEALSEKSSEMSRVLGKKIHDIALIYASYENRLDDETFDAYDELAFVADAVREGDFFAGRTLYFDSFYGFTSPQYDILESALKKAKDVYIALDIPEDMEDGMENGIFDEAVLTKKRLELIAARNGVASDEIYLSKRPDGALGHLDSALFSDNPESYSAPAPEIYLSRSDSIFEECEKCAGYILKNISLGARFRDFSVAVCDNQYLPICESVFSRYGIPSYSNHTQSLISKPAISLILSAIECSFRGFKTNIITEYIKSGFSGISSKSIDIFENYLYTWSPKPYEWESGKPFTKNPFGLSAEEDDESRELLRIVNRVREKIFIPINKLSKAIRNNNGGEDVANAIYDFINEINLPRRISAAAYLAALSERFDDAQEEEAVARILYSVTDDIGRLKSEPLTPEEVYTLFKLVASTYELATIPATLDSVSISTLDRADGERCAHRIVLGANDGLFPSSEHESGFLTDNDRRELTDLGFSLAPSSCDRIFADLKTVHNVLCSAEKGLYISCLTISSRGEEMHESQAMTRLRTVFKSPSEPMSLGDVRMLAKIPCFDECVSSGRDIVFTEDSSHLRERLSAIRHNSNSTRGPIVSKENIEAVFGKKIRLSASRADLFSSCRYAYFLRYGLGAYPKERAEISPIEAGNLMHHVLEKVICRLVAEGTYDLAIASTYAREAAREYLSENLSPSDGLSGRMKFLIEKIEDTVVSAVCDICRELESGSFVPREFELSFSHNGDLPPLELSGENSLVSFSGKVDRIDTYEHDGKLYFRVIDYKSGTKHFSLDETVNGIGMQLLLYMFALEEMGIKRYGTTPQAAGVMYVPLSRNFSETRNTPVSPARREGVILSNLEIIDAMEHGETKYIPVTFKKDGSFSSSSSVLSEKQFAKVKQRLSEILIKIGDELSSGIIDPNPYYDSSSDACRWCDYKSICAFDEERSCDSMRKLCEITAKDIFDKEDEQ